MNHVARISALMCVKCDDTLVCLKNLSTGQASSPGSSHNTISLISCNPASILASFISNTYSKKFGKLGHDAARILYFFDQHVFSQAIQHKRHNDMLASSGDMQIITS